MVTLISTAREVLRAELLRSHCNYKHVLEKSSGMSTKLVILLPMLQVYIYVSHLGTSENF